MYSSLRFQVALVIASLAHHGQKRKISNIPYIVHPITVATTLWRCGFDDDIIIAGLFHDSLEDTKLPRWIIKLCFGSKVYNYVWELTGQNPNYIGYNIESTSPALFIKLADTLSNVADCVLHPNGVSEEKYKKYTTFLQEATLSNKIPILLSMEIKRQTQNMDNQKAS